MSKKMLIDAAHAEEVRVCVLENRKVEDFDFESSARKPLRGNIYLARITRVEPSLQAAFVEYGGNRHGFLAFNEIHPDYYQIPVSDREALQAAEAEEAALAAELDLGQRDDEDEDDGAARGMGEEDDDQALDAELADADDEAEAKHDADQNGGEQPAIEELAADDDAVNDSETDGHDDDQQDDADAAIETVEADAAIDDITDDDDSAHDDNSDDDIVDDDQTVSAETALPAMPLASSSAFPFLNAPAEEEDGEAEEAQAAPAEAGESEEKRLSREKRAKRQALIEKYKDAKRKRARLLRNYKIQEVIKRRQILLVQVVKEERGNKGAALTTYMSLAGRYCVLMPNTARGGGISRKIPNPSDRKRLRRIVDSLDVGQGMGLIIRTAGAKRTKTEIKRDYDYLTRLWENIRSLTLESIAPCLIYEEASLIKRAIRDLYDKDISKVMVEGEEGYREAKDFMKMLMPSHAKNVQPYKEKLPLFVRHDVEQQLDAMYQPTVRLKSGGYLVINQTEALIAVDVNSGKATRERNIELTALKTNLEAAVETARQCRLRDLAGLIVIDFIDMEENKNNRAVEKKLKEALKHDRARIQVGRISGFGLLEMSRQRRRSGIVDGTTHACPTCNGAGAVRSNEMAALRILRAIESDAIAGRAAIIAAKASMDVTLYVLNHKRDWLGRLENDYALTIEIIADETKAGDQYEIEKRGAARPQAPEQSVIRADMTDAVSLDDTEETAASEETPEDEKPARRKRRRRRKKRGDEMADADAQDADAERKEETSSEEAGEAAKEETAEQSADIVDDETGERKKRRRRGRRGGRRKNRRQNEDASDETPSQEAGAAEADDQPADNGAAHETADASSGQPEIADDAPSENDAMAAFDDVVDHDTSPGPENGALPERETETAASANAAADAPVADKPSDQQAPADPMASGDAAPSADEIAERLKKRKSTKKGWWSRAIGG